LEVAASCCRLLLIDYTIKKSRKSRESDA